MKIILAEDDPVSNHFLKMTLKYWGHEIHAFSDGEQAWEAIEEGSVPDLIVSDWEMPNLDGIELCRKVRKDPEMNDVYIILLTAKNLRSDMYHGFQVGADDYIAKPVTEQDLKESLNKGEQFLKDKTMDRSDLRRKNMSNFITRNQCWDRSFPFFQ
jgi:two-component system chemotaxis response regulator CheY